MIFILSIGILAAVAGLAGVIFCLVSAQRFRKAKLEDAEMRDRLHTLVKINLAAVMLALVGLTIVLLVLIL